MPNSTSEDKSIKILVCIVIFLVGALVAMVIIHSINMEIINSTKVKPNLFCIKIVIK